MMEVSDTIFSCMSHSFGMKFLQDDACIAHCLTKQKSKENLVFYHQVCSIFFWTNISMYYSICSENSENHIILHKTLSVFPYRQVFSMSSQNLTEEVLNARINNMQENEDSLGHLLEFQGLLHVVTYKLICHSKESSYHSMSFCRISI